MKEKTKKISYNPFKMWGSLVGGIIGLLGGIFNTYCGGFCQLGGLLFVYSILAILGFLIGWGIHSLCRYLKNKKSRSKK